jgi:hypothetical protein
MLDTGYSMLDTGCWILETRYWIATRNRFRASLPATYTQIISPSAVRLTSAIAANIPYQVPTPNAVCRRPNACFINPHPDPIPEHRVPNAECLLFHPVTNIQHQVTSDK